MRKKWDKVGKCASPDSVFSSSFAMYKKKPQILRNEALLKKLDWISYQPQLIFR
jgi:hypothetical protein